MTTENTAATQRPPSRTLGARRRWVGLLLLLAVFAGGGLYVGVRWHDTFERWLVRSTGSAPSMVTGSDAGRKQLWTCGMHPQVIQDHPGECPICHMKLTPLMTGDTSSSTPVAATGPDRASSQDRKVKYWWDPMMSPPYISDKPGKSPMGMDLVAVYEDQAQSAGPAVVIDPAVVQNMGVRTAVVAEGKLVQRVRVTANVTEPESARRDINLRVSGWVENLYASTDGMAVKKGDPLFDLYSPDLRLAIEELISAHKASVLPGRDAGSNLEQTNASLVEAAERRLSTLGLTTEQIAELGGMQHAPSVVTFTSPIDGLVVEKSGVYTGSAVSAGQVVLRLADRSTMWVEAQVPEGTLNRIHVGQRAAVRMNAAPERVFEGEVVFIHPNLDEMTRTALVRMAMPNPDGALRRGMYATIEINAGSDVPVVLVPREAVIDTGETRVVFLSAGSGKFEPRRVVVGGSGDDGMVQIVSGLEVGETVVTSGQFLLDSESRLREAIAKFLGQRAAGETASPGVASPTAPVAVFPASTQEQVDALVLAYFALAEALGKVQQETAPLRPDGLLATAHSLHGAATDATAKKLVSEVAAAAEALRGKPIDSQREMFKRVSASVIPIIDSLPPSSKAVARVYVVHCPMAKADWLQRSTEIANPYYADEMKECGSVVRTIGRSTGEKGAR